MGSQGFSMKVLGFHRRGGSFYEGRRSSAAAERGSWDLVTTYNWAYNPTYNPPKWAYRGYPNYK